jgi:hypothetical protein
VRPPEHEMTHHDMRIQELSELVRASDYTVDNGAVAEAIIRRQAARRLLLGVMRDVGAGTGALRADARGRADRARRRSH